MISVEQRKRLMDLYEIEIADMTDPQLVELLQIKHQAEIIPKCPICGGTLSVGKMGGGEPTEWACSPQEEDPEKPGMLRYRQGRTFMDDHWRNSHYTQRYHPDPWALELANRHARLRPMNIEDLTTRHNEFLAAMRRCISHGVTGAEVAERITLVQRDYVEWFAKYGITLFVPTEEGAP